MFILKLLAAGLISGIFANITGYLITGRLFHPYQAKTPDTWRKSESWVHYQYAALVRIAACVAIAFLYAALGNRMPVLADHFLLGAIVFALFLWFATMLPLVVEVSLFVNWHRGFVTGLVLDWLVVCLLASVAAGLACHGT